MKAQRNDTAVPSPASLIALTHCVQYKQGIAARAQALSTQGNSQRINNERKESSIIESWVSNHQCPPGTVLCIVTGLHLSVLGNLN
jgi:hypothetical protein